MHSRTVNVVLSAFLNPALAGIILDRINLGKHVEDIKAETVNALIQPEVENVDDFSSYFRIFPVEISLLDTEQMQIELITVAYSFPCTAGKG